MKKNGFYNLFISQLEDMYSAENQIIETLPKLIKLASLDDLKKALSKHLEETKHQVVRIEKICSILGQECQEITCKAMQGLLEEGEEMVKNQTTSPLLDAIIIAAAQKVEHYEMATYGSLRSFAKNLELDSEIIDLIQESLDEEGNADKTLTKIADGGIFFSGINKEAATGARGES